MHDQLAQIHWHINQVQEALPRIQSGWQLSQARPTLTAGEVDQVHHQLTCRIEYLLAEARGFLAATYDHGRAYALRIQLALLANDLEGYGLIPRTPSSQAADMDAAEGWVS